VRRAHAPPCRPPRRPGGDDGHGGEHGGCAGDRRGEQCALQAVAGLGPRGPRRSYSRMTLMALATPVWRPLVTEILRERIGVGEPIWLPVRGRSMRPLLASGSAASVARGA